MNVPKSKNFDLRDSPGIYAAGWKAVFLRKVFLSVNLREVSKHLLTDAINVLTLFETLVK